MRDTRKSGSTVAGLVRKHNRGTLSASGTLDTTAKVREYVERMKTATEERFRQDQRARRDSEARARTRRID